MVGRGAVAVLALDGHVRRAVPEVDLFLMAGFTGLAPLVLDREPLPVADARLCDTAVRVAVLVDAEVVGHIELPDHEEDGDESDDYQQRSPGVAAHTLDLLARPRRSGSRARAEGILRDRPGCGSRKIGTNGGVRRQPLVSPTRTGAAAQARWAPLGAPGLHSHIADADPHAEMQSRDEKDVF